MVRTSANENKYLPMLAAAQSIVVVAVYSSGTLSPELPDIRHSHCNCNVTIMLLLLDIQTWQERLRDAQTVPGRVAA